MKIVWTILLLLHQVFCYGQQVTENQLSSDSITSSQHQVKTASFEGSVNRKRVWLVSGVSAAAYGTSLIALNQTWYKNFPKTSFHTFNDAGEWLQMDKVGHAWSVYNLSRGSFHAWKWTGLKENNAVIVSSLSGFTYLTVIELLDARSQKWGWSWADMGANFTGSSLFALQQISWKEQRIQFKFSAHKKNYNAELTDRADELFGKTTPERLLKDYNGQTYWLSFNLHSFTKNKKLPTWLNLSVGYGADGMFGGYENIALDKNGNPTFMRHDIKRRRQWYLAPDIDVTKIKTHSKLLKTLLTGFNCIKIPAPALQFSNGKFSAHLIQF